jgi:hypothetical protein
LSWSEKAPELVGAPPPDTAHTVRGSKLEVIFMGSTAHREVRVAHPEPVAVDSDHIGDMPGRTPGAAVRSVVREELRLIV